MVWIYYPIIFERGIIGNGTVCLTKSDWIISAESGHTNSKYVRR